MEDRSSYMLNFQEQHQVMADVDEEFEGVTRRLIQFDHDRANAELEEQDLQKQFNSQQQHLTQLLEQVESTRNQLKEIRHQYQQQQEYIIQIAHHQREIPKMDSRIAELKAVLQEHQKVVGIQIGERTSQLDMEIEQKKQAHKETLDQKSKQLERDLKALRQILAQEDDSGIFESLREQHRDELDHLRVELQNELEHQRVNMHNKCHSNVEELKKKIEALKSRIQLAESTQVQ